MQVGEPLQMRKPIDCGDSSELIYSPAFHILFGVLYSRPLKEKTHELH